jgi:hypothetical protein
VWWVIENQAAYLHRRNVSSDEQGLRKCQLTFQEVVDPKARQSFVEDTFVNLRVLPKTHLVGQNDSVQLLGREWIEGHHMRTLGTIARHRSPVKHFIHQITFPEEVEIEIIPTISTILGNRRLSSR